MLFEIMMHIKNFFPAEEGKFDKYKVENGTVTDLALRDNQYFLIEGSVFNDGVHQFPTTDLVEEEFDGIITPLAIPKAFLDLVEEIKSYVAKDIPTPYTSESFGGYSYTKATGRNGKTSTWADAFSTRLNAWRKI